MFPCIYRSTYWSKYAVSLTTEGHFLALAFNDGMYLNLNKINQDFEP